ncbi:hypothetical protein Tco_1065303 [Tanacetum coccineum]
MSRPKIQPRGNLVPINSPSKDVNLDGNRLNPSGGNIHLRKKGIIMVLRRDKRSPENQNRGKKDSTYEASDLESVSK